MEPVEREGREACVRERVLIGEFADNGGHASRKGEARRGIMRKGLKP